MSAYEVYHGMDPERLLGVLTTGDDDIVKSYKPVDEDGLNRFSFAVVTKMSMGEVEGRWRNYVFAPKDGEVKKGEEVQVAGEIVKTDPAKRLVFGWAYVTHDRDGELNIDKSGDFADDIEEIEKSAYDYVLRSRQGDADHTNVKASEMVESIVFTPEKIEKMGIPAGSVPMGWWVGYKIHDDETWGRVERKELVSFSIHGKGTRSKVE